MRKNYVKPALISEEFAPQVYCAACEHTSSGVGMYIFTCNAGGGEKGDIFTKEGENLTPNSFMNTRYYHACSTQHEAPTTDDFIDGYFYKNGGNDTRDGYTPVEVVIWKETLYNRWGLPTGEYDIHATTILDRDSWEKNIS